MQKLRAYGVWVMIGWLEGLMVGWLSPLRRVSHRKKEQKERDDFEIKFDKKFYFKIISLSKNSSSVPEARFYY